MSSSSSVVIILLCTSILLLSRLIKSEDEDGIVAQSWSGLKSRVDGIKKYLDSFDIKAIFCQSGDIFRRGRSRAKKSGNIPARDKPSYLYSAGAIRQLAVVEGDIYTAMGKYVERQQRLLDKMKLYMQDYEESSVNVVNVSQSERDYMVVANPIIGHRLIHRLAKDFVEIVESVEVSVVTKQEFEEDLRDANPEQVDYPNVKEDYEQSISAILRIQRYSNIKTEDLAYGKLGNLSTGVGLKAKHALDIGLYSGSLEEPNYAAAVEWLEMALEKLDGEEGPVTTADVDPGFRDKVEGHLDKAAKMHDTACSSKQWTRALENCFTNLLRGDYGAKKESDRVRAAVYNQKKAEAFHSFKEYSAHTRRNFINVCSGKNLQSEEEKSRLYCWYEHKKSPYLRIAPVKMELLNGSPELYQIYDLLGPKRIEKLMTTATPNLKRSFVINTTDPNSNVLSDVRTSMQTWIYDDDQKMRKFLDGISRQIEYATGLNVRNLRARASEAYQIASYRTSHHYDEHMDALQDVRRTKVGGDRIATVMFYLSDVDEGGMTGFPCMGTAARPVKGSAMFWYNLLKNGVADKRTWHGGCPVVHGVKWVCNKWILLNENFDKRLCSLDKEE